MDYLAIVGASCLGLFVGLIIGWYVNQEKGLDPKSLNSIILGLGSSIVSFVPLFSPQSSREIWFYPVALLVGLLIAPFFDIAYNRLYEKWDK